jgi:hypothetical protein
MCTVAVHGQKLLREDRVRRNDGHMVFPFSNRHGGNFWSVHDAATK